MHPTDPSGIDSPRAFLFLQGPTSGFFSRIADGLEQLGHRAYRINLSVGDQLFWRRGGATNYRGRLEEWPDFVADFMDRHAITDLLLLGEQREYHKRAIEAAQQRRIQVTVTDFGYLRPDWITFEHDGMSACSRFPRDPDTIRELAAPLPDVDLGMKYPEGFAPLAIRDLLYNLANYFLAWRYPNYKINLRLLHPLHMYLGTAKRLLHGRSNERRAQALLTEWIGHGQRFFVYPLQIAYDYQILAYSDFDSQEEAVEQVVTSFATHANDTDDLLIKVHPLDPGTTDWDAFVRTLAVQLGVSDRVYFIDGGNLDQICDHAHGMVTINSTSGLSALQHDCPLIALGKAIYDVPGLTFQHGLDRFWTECEAPVQQLRDAYIKLMAASIQLRGRYFSHPGLDAAVKEAVHRLHHRQVNQPVQQGR